MSKSTLNIHQRQRPSSAEVEKGDLNFDIGATRVREVEFRFPDDQVFVAGHQAGDNDEVTPALIRGFRIVQTQLTSMRAGAEGAPNKVLSVEFYGVHNTDTEQPIRVLDDGSIEFLGDANALVNGPFDTTKNPIITLSLTITPSNSNWALLPSRALGNPRIRGEQTSARTNLPRYVHLPDNEFGWDADYSGMRSMTMSIIMGAKQNGNPTVSAMLNETFESWKANQEVQNTEKGSISSSELAEAIKQQMSKISV
jgi:hypothetical protein